MIRNHRICVIALALFAAAGNAVAQVPKEVKTVSLPVKVFESAIDPESGNVAVVSAKGSTVTVFTKLADGANEKTEIKVGTVTTGIAYKKVGKDGFFLALCSGDKTLYVIDPVALKVVNKIAIKGKNPVYLHAPATADDPHVYCMTTQVKDNFNQSLLHRLNLKTNQDEGQVEIPSYEIAFSGDGKLIYTRDATSSEEGPFIYSTRPDKDLEISLVSKVGEQTYHIQTDPGNGFFIMGNNAFVGEHAKKHELFPAYDTTDSYAAMLNGATAFHPEKPIFFSYRETSIQAFSSNTFKPLGMVELPKPKRKEDYDPTKMPLFTLEDILYNFFYTRMHLAPKQQKLIVVLQDKAIVAPLSAFNMPAEPVLAVDVSVPVITPGDEAVIKLTPKDKNTAIKLADGPNAATLEGDAIKWKTRSSTIGAYTFKLRLTSADGKVEQTKQFDAVVRWPSIKIGVIPNEPIVATDHSALFLAGEKEACVFDLNKRAVTVQKPFQDYPIAMDATQIYAISKDYDGINIYNRKDLSKAKSIPLKTRVDGIAVSGDKLYLMLPGEMQDSFLRVYQLPDVKLISETKPNIQLAMDDMSRYIPIAVGDGWYVNGTLFDATMKKPALLYYPPMIHKLGGDERQQFVFFNRENRPRAPYATWGAAIKDITVLEKPVGIKAANLPDTRNVILPDVPLLAAISRETRVPDKAAEEAGNRHIKVVLSLHDLNGKRLDGFQLIDETFPGGLYPGPRRQDDMPTYIHAREGEIIAIDGNELFFFDTKKLTTGLFEPRLTFPLAQPSLTADVNKPSTMQFTAKGEIGPLTYGVTTKAPGISIDAETGKVKIDLAPHQEKLYAAFLSSLLYGQIEALQGNPKPEMRLAQEIANYHKLVDPVFKELTGRDPDGIPFFLPFTVTATTSKQAAAELPAGVLIELPDAAPYEALRNAKAAKKGVDGVQKE